MYFEGHGLVLYSALILATQLLSLLYVPAHGEGIAGQNCDQLGVLLYEDLECKPITAKDGGGDCPIQFECKNFTRTKTHCTFGRRKLALGDTLDNNATYKSCAVGCRCARTFDIANASADFNCAVLDCPENLERNDDDNNCYRTYSLDQCCASGTACPPFKTAATKCTIDGQVYREGERFQPENVCLDCICQKSLGDDGGDGERALVGVPPPTHCRRQTCATQLRRAKELEMNCAPVYLINSNNNRALCCPFEWICPSKTVDAIEIITKNNNKRASDLFCKFGGKQLKLGEGFRRHSDEYNNEIQCECALPPLLTCKFLKPFE